MKPKSLNSLYYGDNLNVLRENIHEESVDLVYLDPPFNSKRDYNLLFKSPEGQESHAQITAFEDSWHWGEQAEREFEEIIHGHNTRLAQLIPAFRSFLGENDMLAYLTMMASRLVELHRVLKPTGSLYLHCDPAASHYLKLLLDSVFGPERFLNEVIWKRTSAHSSAKRYGPLHDTILFYGKTDKFLWNSIRTDYEDAYLEKYYKFDDGDGRLYWRADLCAAGIRHGSSGMPWRGINPAEKGMHWKYTIEKLEALDAEGRIYWPPKGTMPQFKRYREDLKGKAVGDIWDDIDHINPVGSERLGYPTQKPLTLLERIISASSNPGDIVLDPFCGCGTATHAAQKLGRHWIGIDITHLAISLIEKRLKDAFPGINFDVHGTPKDLAGAQDLAARDKYQFQWWAVSLVGAQPFGGQKKGADGGIDGVIFFGDVGDDGKKATQKIIVSVKGGEHVTVNMIRDLKGTIEREKAAIGVFLTLTPPTKPMKVEAATGGFYKGVNGKSYPKIQILTVEDLLEGHQHPEFPDLSMGTLTFKAPKVEKTKGAAHVSLFEDIG